MDYPKSVPGVGLVDGKFIDENTTTGQVGSLIPCSWGNAVTDELLNVIRAGGEDPVEGETDQLVAAIRTIVRDSIPPEQIRKTLAEYGITDAYTKAVTYTKAEIEGLLKNLSALPVGAMVPFPKGTVPTGFLEVDGSVKSSATYPDLSAYLGTTYNIGDEGAGNFRLPESRGEFLRGWDHGRGVDVGRGIGTYQLSQNLRHVHPAPLAGSTQVYAEQFDPASWVPSGSIAKILIQDSGTINDNGTATPLDWAGSGGTEARPRNLAVMWCIKAWNAPINQGNIDIAALAVLAGQATESKLGTARVATQAQVNEGLDDTALVTSKKLRWGFSALLAQNGFVAFPSWLGGLVLQWGKTSITVATNGGVATVSLPMAFPTNHFGGFTTYVASVLASGAYIGYYDPVSLSTAGLVLEAIDATAGSGARSAFYFSIGN